MSVATISDRSVESASWTALSRDGAVKWGLIATMLAAAPVIAWARGMVIAPRDFMQPAGIAGLLGAVGFFYARFRPEPRFVLCAHALLHTSLFTLGYTFLMYVTASVARPLVDEQLGRCDALLGVHLPSIVAWAGEYPRVAWLLNAAYGSVLPQTALVIMLLSFGFQRRELEGFVLQFMFGALVCLVCFALWPAAGPFELYGYETDAVQARYLEHLHSLRDGSRTAISWRGAEGLVTFPSFHTIWAIILAYAVRRTRWALAIALPLNVMVVAATLTTGWHYGTDVIAGAVVAVGVIVAAKWVQQRSPLPPGEVGG